MVEGANAPLTVVWQSSYSYSYSYSSSSTSSMLDAGCWMKNNSIFFHSRS